MSRSELRVLIADDQQAAIDAVKSHLLFLEKSSPWKLSIAETHSAIGVLQYLEKSRVDVIFLDQEFRGGMSGEEIIDDLIDPFGSRMVVFMSHLELDKLQGAIARNFRKWGDRFEFMSKEITKAAVFAVLQKITKYFTERPYPFPLAHAHKLIDSISDAHGKFDGLRDLSERIAQYSVAVLMAELTELTLAGDVSVKLGWSGTMTFGAWLRWLGELLKLVKPHESRLVVRHLVGTLEDSKFQVEGQQVTGLNLLYHLKNTRDLLASHGHAHSDEFYKELVNKYADPIDRLYRQLRFLADYPLLRVEAIDLKRDDEFEYQVRLLMRSDPTFSVTKLSLRVRLPRETIFILSFADARVLRMHPFVLFRMCQACRTQHVFLLDAASDKCLRYNAQCDNRMEVPECMKDLRELYPKLMQEASD